MNFTRITPYHNTEEQNLQMKFHCETKPGTASLTKRFSF